MTPVVEEIIDAARELAWFSHVNTSSVKLYRRRLDAFERLRETLTAFHSPPPARIVSAEPELGALLMQAYRVAACSAANRTGTAYQERKEAFALLRGCLTAFDALTLDTERPPTPEG